MGAINEKHHAFFAKVSGRVQGVGFRYSAIQEAQRLGLHGWVRNTPGREVEVWAEGMPENLEHFSAWLRRGPPLSRIDSVKKETVAPAGYNGFKAEF